MKQKNYAVIAAGIIMLLFPAAPSFAQFIINSPNASTVWEIDQNQTITWTNPPAPPTVVTITLNYHNGPSPISYSLGVNVPTAPGTYTFKLDSAFGNGRYYTVCFEDEQENVFTCSDTFAISDSMPEGVREIDAHAISVYPMPLTHISRLNFTLKKAAPVEAVIYNTLGREVYRLQDEMMEPGNIDIALPRMPESGIYFLQVKIAESYFTQKLVAE